MKTIKKEQLNQGTIRFHGRINVSNQGTHFFYTGSGFDVQFEGTKVIAYIKTDYQSENKKPFLTVYSGENQELVEKVIELNLGENIVELCNLNQGVHLLQVKKRSESMMSRTILTSLETDGRFLTIDPVKPDLKIEWIGDSLTCGFGNVGKSADVPFRTEDEDGMRSFATIASTILKADYQIIAVSGIGVYKSFYAEVTMPCIYEQKDIYCSEPYDFDYKPDWIVLNLGTNDHSYMKFLMSNSLAYEKENFKKAYIKFVEKILEKNEKSKVLCISQGNRQFNVDLLIEEAVKLMSNPRLHHFRVSDILESDGMGSQYHPTVKTHSRWGFEIASEIKKLNNIKENV